MGAIDLPFSPAVIFVRALSSIATFYCNMRQLNAHSSRTIGGCSLSPELFYILKLPLSRPYFVFRSVSSPVFTYSDDTIMNVPRLGIRWILLRRIHSSMLGDRSLNDFIPVSPEWSTNSPYYDCIFSHLLQKSYLFFWRLCVFHGNTVVLFHAKRRFRMRSHFVFLTRKYVHMHLHITYLHTTSYVRHFNLSICT